MGEVRVVDGKLYATFPKAASMDGGKPWIAFSLPAGIHLSRAAPLMDAVMGASGSNGLVGILSKVAASVLQVGHGAIHGHPVTEYRATLEVSKLLGGLGAGARKLMDALPAAARTWIGGLSVPLEVWIGAHGRLRQASVSVGFLGYSLDLTLDLAHFGLPVVVSAPPASQVATQSLCEMHPMNALSIMS